MRGRGSEPASWPRRGDPEAGAAGGDDIAQREVAQDASGCEVTFGPGEGIAGKVLVRRHSWRVGVGEAVRDDVKPTVELILIASAYLDPGRRHGLDLTIKDEAKHVLKRLTRATARKATPCCPTHRTA